MWRGGVVVRPLDSVCMGPVTSTGSPPVCLLLQPIGLVEVHLPRAYIQNGYKTTTKRYQNHIDLANEKSFGHQIFVITDEI